MQARNSRASLVVHRLKSHGERIDGVAGRDVDVGQSRLVAGVPEDCSAGEGPEGAVVAGDFLADSCAWVGC